jgi:hypothetical protein
MPTKGQRKKRPKRPVKRKVAATTEPLDYLGRLWDAENWDAEARKIADESRPQLTTSVFFILK